MSVNRKKAQNASNDLVSAGDKLYQFLKEDPKDEIPDDEIGPLFREIEEKYIALSQQIEAQAQRSTFSEFFSSMGESVVAAQSKLDDKSNMYLESTRGNKHVLPTVFRIPKITAEIKFALEKSKEKEVDLIFYSEREKATSMHQQSVKFEIVAVPAPTELVEKLRSLSPQLELILSPRTRRLIFDAVGACETSLAVHKEVLLQAENRDSVLISAVEPEKRFLLLFANNDEEKHIGVWHLIFDPPKLEPVYFYDRAPGQGEVLQPMKDFVLELAKKQAKFLKQMN